MAKSFLEKYWVIILVAVGIVFVLPQLSTQSVVCTSSEPTTFVALKDSIMNTWGFEGRTVDGRLIGHGDYINLIEYTSYQCSGTSFFNEGDVCDTIMVADAEEMVALGSVGFQIRPGYEPFSCSNLIHHGLVYPTDSNGHPRYLTVQGENGVYIPPLDWGNWRKSLIFEEVDSLGNWMQRGDVYIWCTENDRYVLVGSANEYNSYNLKYGEGEEPDDSLQNLASTLVFWDSVYPTMVPKEISISSTPFAGTNVAWIALTSPICTGGEMGVTNICSFVVIADAMNDKFFEATNIGAGDSCRERVQNTANTWEIPMTNGQIFAWNDRSGVEFDELQILCTANDKYMILGYRPHLEEYMANYNMDCVAATSGLGCNGN